MICACFSLKDYFFTFKNKWFVKWVTWAGESVHLHCCWSTYCCMVCHLTHGFLGTDYICRGEDRCYAWMTIHGKIRVACSFFLFVRCTYTNTCDVYSKALRIPWQLKALLHTPQEYGHFQQDMLWSILVNTVLTLQTSTSCIFSAKHNMYMSFTQGPLFHF